MSYLGLLLTSFSYLALLFGIAYRADLYKARGRSWINNANVYSLSLAVYCTAWTFYGSVGLAAKGGVMFLPIYLGPTLLALLWSGVLRKMIRIAKRYAITSLADFLSVRYGNSTFLGGWVTVIAFVGIIPYISLQIKAIGFGFDLIAQSSGNSADTSSDSTTFFITLALVAFTILFGVRHLDATERHEGMVAAIAFESIVKLLAFVVCGVVVVYGGFGGLGALFKEAVQKPELAQSWSFTSPGVYEDWFFLNLLAMLAILLLPRQFQVAVVENVNEDHVNRASWLFPLYLLVINLFVLPLALAGRLLFPEGNVDADTFVLTLPLLLGNDLLAWFVFIGGFSAATGMIVVETVALSNMLCNSLIMPILIRLPFVNLKEGRGLNSVLLFIRRGSVALVLLASYAYYQLVGSAYSLVSIGLISFLAVAQFAPSIIGGLYWSQ
ncbi:MAG: histidine kinase, partial [bacterium]